MNIKQTLQNIWAIEDNRNIIKDGLIFGIVTIIFHFLYWNTNMNSWLFGPFTTEIFDFFTRLAYNGTHSITYPTHSVESWEIPKVLIFIPLSSHSTPFSK